MHLGVWHPDELLQGSSLTILKIPLGTWRGKKREFVLKLPTKTGLTGKQINEWMAYMNIEPFGEYRNELRHGQIMALTMNLNRDPKKHPTPFSALDYMNFVEKPPEKKLTPEEIEAHFDKIFR